MMSPMLSREGRVTCHKRTPQATRGELAVFGADKGEEVGPYEEFKDRDDEECEDVEDDQA